MIYLYADCLCNSIKASVKSLKAKFTMKTFFQENWNYKARNFIYYLLHSFFNLDDLYTFTHMLFHLTSVVFFTTQIKWSMRKISHIWNSYTQTHTFTWKIFIKPKQFLCLLCHLICVQNIITIFSLQNTIFVLERLSLDHWNWYKIFWEIRSSLYRKNFNIQCH